MDEKLVARASTDIDAPVAEVWEALVTPATIKRYMFGTTVVSDFKKGSPIVWKGEWEGREYEDKGVIQRVERPRVLEYTHYSPLMGKPDVPESYHTVTIQLTERGEGTRVSLAQDNNETQEAKAHSEKNWTTMLDGLKKEVEK
jgi:uncharacterized protein YndB with AHSA1/START domain